MKRENKELDSNDMETLKTEKAQNNKIQNVDDNVEMFNPKI